MLCRRLFFSEGLCYEATEGFQLKKDYLQGEKPTHIKAIQRAFSLFKAELLAVSYNACEHADDMAILNSALHRDAVISADAIAATGRYYAVKNVLPAISFIERNVSAARWRLWCFYYQHVSPLLDEGHHAVANVCVDYPTVLLKLVLKG